MVKIILHKITKEYVQYRFYPEGEDGEYGIIQVNLENYDFDILKDIPGIWDAYKFHACSHINKLVRNGEFSEESWEAWY